MIIKENCITLFEKTEYPVYLNRETKEIEMCVENCDLCPMTALGHSCEEMLKILTEEE